MSGSTRRAIKWRWMLAEYERLGGICPDCSSPMDLRFSLSDFSRHTNEATVDHIEPAAYRQGGLDNKGNWRLVCYQCNHSRGERTNRQIPGPGAFAGQQAVHGAEEQWMDVAGVGKTIAGRVVRAIRNGHRSE